MDPIDERLEKAAAGCDVRGHRARRMRRIVNNDEQLIINEDNGPVRTAADSRSQPDGFQPAPR
jgi:hypothetical protein